jgi:hypothetical protein
MGRTGMSVFSLSIRTSVSLHTFRIGELHPVSFSPGPVAELRRIHEVYKACREFCSAGLAAGTSGALGSVARSGVTSDRPV